MKLQQDQIQRKEKMEKKKSSISERSKCCGAKVVVRGRTTLHYECLKCGYECDIYYVERKTWTRNPKTQILGDEREKINKKETDKEIKEMGCA